MEKMNKTQHYVTGKWIDGTGDGSPIFDSVTGEQFTSVTVEGLDIPSILQYGREKVLKWQINTQEIQSTFIIKKHYNIAMNKMRCKGISYFRQSKSNIHSNKKG